MAHARRYFEKALDNDKSRASYVLEQIQKLYTIERKIKERSITKETIKRYREICAKPILEALHGYSGLNCPLLRILIYRNKIVCRSGGY